MLTFKAFSVLIDYPTEERRQALPEIMPLLRREALLPPSALQAIGELVSSLQQKSLLDVQQDYVELFDRGRKLSLHIFEHTHGESRDRGPAMLALMEQYQNCGMELAASELPDFLPLVLEFASCQPFEEARLLISEAMPVLTLLAARLHQRKSLYAAVFDALEAIAGPADDREELLRQVTEEGPDEALVNIDKVWEEEAITFEEKAALGERHNAGTTITSPGTEEAGQILRWVDSSSQGASTGEIRKATTGRNEA